VSAVIAVTKRRLALAGALLLATCASCGRSDEVRATEDSEPPPPTLDVPADHPYAGPHLADFELRECHGRKVTLADLAGRACVLDFVFTTCAGPCPSMSTAMAALQGELADTDALLVSVSVDPATDDAATLRAYAELYDADPERWWFLTGDPAQMAALAASVQLAVVPEQTEDVVLGYQVAHATKFVVVDGEGVVRGYYDGRTEDGRRAAAARVRHFARAR